MPDRVPRSGTFELTVRCDLRCRMCLFRHDVHEDGSLRAHELTASQWVDMAREAAEAGMVNLLVTGGEPMLRPDFPEIWEGIYRFGFLTELYTNATLVTPRVMEVLRRCPPHRIGVTVYGSTPEVYGRVCGEAGAFGRMVSGVRQLQTLPSAVSFRTTIIRDNLNDLPGIDRLVSDTFGCAGGVELTRLVTRAVRGGCADAEACRLSAREQYELMLSRAVRRVTGECGGKDTRLRAVVPEAKPPDRLTLLGCSAGMDSFAVTYDGYLQGCQMLDTFRTDAARLGFSEAWETFPQTVRLPPPHPDCLSCGLQSLCASCPAFRLSETGSVGGKPDYICETTRITEEIIRRDQI